MSSDPKVLEHVDSLLSAAMENIEVVRVRLGISNPVRAGSPVSALEQLAREFDECAGDPKQRIEYRVVWGCAAWMARRAAISAAEVKNAE